MTGIVDEVPVLAIHLHIGDAVVVNLYCYIECLRIVAIREVEFQ